jgi:membrane protease YdiL (CAAX protease family)
MYPTNAKSLLSQVLTYWKEEIIGLAVFLTCILLVIFFPTNGHLQQFSSVFFFFFVVPFLYIKFILKKNVRDFGFNLENKKTGFLWAAAMLGVTLLIFFILIKTFNFHTFYSTYLGSNFFAFLFYQLVLVNFILFMQEFFFKGFLLFSLENKLGIFAFLIQAIVFISFLGLTTSFSWQMAPMAILSLTGGFVAYKSKSFVYSYLMSLVFLIILDTYIIYLFK